MCKKQTCVSNSSKESEIISLDAGLRMDAIPALDLRCLVVDVMHSNSDQKQKVKQSRGNPLHGKVSEKRVNLQCNTQVPQRHLELFDIDIVSSNRILPVKEPCCTFLKTTKL